MSIRRRTKMISREVFDGLECDGCKTIHPCYTEADFQYGLTLPQDTRGWWAAANEVNTRYVFCPPCFEAMRAAASARAPSEATS